MPKIIYKFTNLALNIAAIFCIVYYCKSQGIPNERILKVLKYTMRICEI